MLCSLGVIVVPASARIEAHGLVLRMRGIDGMS